MSNYEHLMYKIIDQSTKKSKKISSLQSQLSSTQKKLDEGEINSKHLTKEINLLYEEIEKLKEYKFKYEGLCK